MAKKKKQSSKVKWLDRIKAAIGIGAIVADPFLKNPNSRAIAQEVKDGADIAISLAKNGDK